MDASAAVVVELTDVDPGSDALVGGKAAALAALIRAGERVPAGFCVTTAADVPAGSVPDDLRREILLAYARLGRGPVAVRSSATAEDLAHASFAGQHETFLNVDGDEALIDAVRRCRDSLGNDRAVSYRAAHDIAGDTVRMAVVVQRMVDPSAAGVLFTANPITGTRTEMVVDAVAGLGDVVVDGSAAADHYVLDGGRPLGDAGGCLNTVQLAQLREAGERLQQRAGAPQDVEWAFDRAGTLWLLQSRAITTLFPPPQSPGPGPRVYLEVGHMQGMLRPFTPMGMSAMRVAMAQWLRSVGVASDPLGDRNGIADAAGRMFLDITPFVRNRMYRAKLPSAMTVYGPRVAEALQRVLEDPRFAAVPGLPFRVRTVLTVAARLAPGLVAGLLGALVAPAAARRRAFRAAAGIRRRSRVPETTGSAADHLRRAVEAQGPAALGSMTAMLPPLYASMIAKAVAAGLLAGVATASEVDETLRGMPYNITTGMDLDLWRLAAAAGRHRELLLHTPPAELAARYRAGELPEIGLTGFLRRYGHRGAAEIDVGVARWVEDPAPVFAAIAGYLRVTDPEQAADRRFARAAGEATAKIDELVARARPVRARLAGVLLRRSRALAGLRELPKFAWLHAFAAMRAHLLAAGADLRSRGLLERAGDIMFLDLREAFEAAGGADLRERVADRRAEYERELGRHSVPGLLLSDGTVPEALAPRTPAPDGTLAGMAAAPGRVTGRARVILDPAGARMEPGEILVAPTTDPGWTPLFMTAGGLVTETGSPMAHGPTVAREYGIPAVICLRDATQLITTGQLITVDGAAGTVTPEPVTEARPDAAPPHAHAG
ncbi:pyruvate, water dikinase [Pseudonocardia sp. C8]|uniref:PEP/pyruvate-binding domain-containing protein n=1 Tax=Pseudonocardia sp. C8 TaxID=2762759 RepID=UPI0016426E2B|nr:PEP/pyruvate-binding domain-containing protein [Pseudonocardia sp. C8]MBC3190344.1 pyruvate, water dikinase [Pseudonocardia sp. C8]